MTARQRTRDIFVYVVGVVVVAGIVASFFVTRSEVHDVGSRVTKVESPCLRYGPKSPQCRAAFEAAVATITHPEACAVERKAGTLRAIRELATEIDATFTEPCAGARLAQERRRGNEREATSKEQTSHAAGSSPTTGSGGGSMQGTGGSPAPHHPGSHHPPAPPSEPAASPPAPTQPEQEQQQVGGGGSGESSTSHESVLESAGSTVGEVVTGAGEVVGSAACGLTGPLLCSTP